MQNKPKQKKKLFNLIILLIFLIFIVSAAINLYIVAFSRPYIYNVDDIEQLPEKYAGMALGAKVWPSGSLSLTLRDRVDYAVLLYDSDKVTRLLFSGDHGRHTYDEVNAMMDYALLSDVPKSDIFLDHAGFSTYESMYRAKDVFECDELIVITQGFHLYRAVYIARKLGIDAVGLRANQTNYVARIDIKNNTREFFARVQDFFTVAVFRPKPTYLGEAIPITGDASLTHDQ